MPCLTRELSRFVNFVSVGLARPTRSCHVFRAPTTSASPPTEYRGWHERIADDL